jgi:hypothetical protein
MKIFLDAFIVYRDMESHLMKHRFYFQKCKEYKVNLNSEECAFMVFSGLILGFIISKEGKILIHIIFRFLMVWLSFINVSSRNFPLSWHRSPS